MALPDSARRLRAFVVPLSLGLVFVLGWLSHQTGSVLVRANGYAEASDPASWWFAHAEEVVLFGRGALVLSIGAAGLLAIVAFVKTWLGLRSFGKSDPLSARMDLWSARAELPARDWRLGVIAVYLAVLGGGSYLIADGGGHAAFQQPSLGMLLMFAVALAFVPAVFFVARWQRWSERQFRRVERRVFARHAQQLDARLDPEEKIHNYGLAFPLRHVTGRGAVSPLLTLVTDKRLFVARPLLFGLDLVREESVHLGKIGAVRAEAPSAIRDFFRARPGMGQTGVLVVDRLGEKSVRLRMSSMDDARAMASALAELKSSEKAGAGALAIAELDDGGGLSLPQADGALSEAS